ncbi:hypothetical protein E2C01_060706 [Portunus trituberculatus]|uniref:Uncharacterized protein n=1 Tax=Portunus trituberculatus TaxID=210409 RepID=A0A5B7HB97_PORTR|nr:hypothetical protein [Portunus trituberculatus]
MAYEEGVGEFTVAFRRIHSHHLPRYWNIGALRLPVFPSAVSLACMPAPPPQFREAESPLFRPAAPPPLSLTLFPPPPGTLLHHPSLPRPLHLPPSRCLLSVGRGLQ